MAGTRALAAAIVVSLLPSRERAARARRRRSAAAPSLSACPPGRNRPASISSLKPAGSSPLLSARSWRERSKLVPTSRIGRPRLAGHAHEEAFHAHLPHSPRGALERRSPGYGARLRLHMADVLEAPADGLPAAIRRVARSTRRRSRSTSAPASRAGATSSESSCHATPSPARTRGRSGKTGSTTRRRETRSAAARSSSARSSAAASSRSSATRATGARTRPTSTASSSAFSLRRSRDRGSRPCTEGPSMRSWKCHTTRRSPHSAGSVASSASQPSRRAGTTLPSARAGGHDALKQRSVRQAIAYGIDRDALVRQLYPDLRGLHPVQNFIFLPGQRFYEPHWKAYSYQPAKARRLLEDAGCRRGTDGIYICFGRPCRFDSSRPLASQFGRGRPSSSRRSCGELASRCSPTSWHVERSSGRSSRTATTTSRSSSGAAASRPGRKCRHLALRGPAQFHRLLRSARDSGVRPVAVHRGCGRPGPRSEPRGSADGEARPGTSPLSGSFHHSLQGHLRGLVFNGTFEGLLWNSEDWWRER